MGRLRETLALAAIGAALTATSASGSEGAPASIPAVPTEAPSEPGAVTPAPEPAPVAPAASPEVQQGATLVAPPVKETGPKPHHVAAPAGGGKSKKHDSAGGVVAKPKPHQAKPAAPGSPAQATRPGPFLSVPIIPSGSCAGSGVPPVLIPIYQRAAAAYSLGPQGPSVLAGINEIETAFGTNLNISSAGAIGWMQFMPSTWKSYGVDANGDGVADPYNPEDAIYAAARYLSAAGMPTDTYGAIYAYNHADWYVAEVLGNAACYSSIGSGVAGAFSLEPQIRELDCRLAPAWSDEVPGGVPGGLRERRLAL